MKFLVRKNLIALTVALAMMPFWNILSPVLSSATTTNQASRWARFELNEQDSTGDLQTGKPLTLAITLGGVAPGPIPIVALCESILFEPQTVTLEPDAVSSTLKAEVTLVQMPWSRTSVPQRGESNRVTFARVRQDR